MEAERSIAYAGTRAQKTKDDHIEYCGLKSECTQKHEADAELIISEVASLNISSDSNLQLQYT